jgi:hypothetical protein
MKSILKIFIALALPILSGCAHSYYYVPEISGDGAVFGRNGVIYSIPPQQPDFKMKLVSMGMQKAPAAANAPEGTKMIQIRMYIVRPDSKSVPAFIDPKEQVLIFTNGAEVRPTFVHARTVKKPVVELSDSKKQAIEFFFPMALATKDASYVQFFSLRWKIHYGNKAEQQVVRFDRQDSRPQQGAEMFPGDPLYPYDEAPEFVPNDWEASEWGWWGMPI